MPTIVCERCGEKRTADSYAVEPSCDVCGGTTFRPLNQVG